MLRLEGKSSGEALFQRDRTASPARGCGEGFGFVQGRVERLSVLGLQARERAREIWVGSVRRGFRVGAESEMAGLALVCRRIRFFFFFSINYKTFSEITIFLREARLWTLQENQTDLPLTYNISVNQNWIDPLFTYWNFY